MAGLKSILLASSLAACQAASMQNPLRLHDDSQTPLGASDKTAANSGKDKPLIDTEALQAKISSKNLLARAEELYQIATLSQEEYNHPTRVIGSEGHNGTLSYIYNALANLGGYYSLSEQPFTAVSGNVFESRLLIGNDVLQYASPMGLTPPTKGREPVHGKLVLVSNVGCEIGDYPAEVAGNIALISRGVCPFGTKSALAGKSGAKAAIVYNDGKDNVQGTLGTPSPDNVATFGIGGGDAAPYIEKLKMGATVDVIAYIDAVVNQIITNNIVAETVEGDHDNVVMLGGHSDSVAPGPGINDDGTGSLSLLEVATQLTNFKVKNAVRFAWWSGEEEGLLGSDYYVEQLSDSENEKIRLFMDYDMMASPNFAYQVYNATNKANPTGSEELRDLYVDWYTTHGLNYSFIAFDGRSDYDAFIRNGIPGGGIATGAEGVKTEQEATMFGGKVGEWYDPCYHQLCDDVSNVNLTAWEVNTKLIAHSVATYALSFDSFPKRQAVAAATFQEQPFKYHGSKLII